MDDFSVGDFAQQLLNQDKVDKRVTPPPPALEFVNEQQVDISKVDIPQNFLEVITENKELELPAQNKVLTEDKAELVEENPVAGKAIDIIIEGLSNMLDTVKNTLNEVKEFVNENSITTEMTSVGMGIGAPAPTKKKETPEKDDKKKDRLKRVLAKAKGKKKSQA